MSRHSVLCCDSRARSYVTARRDARMTKTHEEQRYYVATEISLSRHTWYNGKKKKKKGSLGLGCHILCMRI